MPRSVLSNAWKWLFVQFLATTMLTYLSILLIVKLQWLPPLNVFRIATYNQGLITGPFLGAGQVAGIDLGILIFFCNLSGALMIVFSFYSVLLLNPDINIKRLNWIIRQLQRKRSFDILQIVPPFSKICQPHLRATSFILLAAPVLSTLALGILAGTLLAAVHTISGSSILAMAYVLPHGFAEIMAYLIASSVPLAAWLSISPALYRGDQVAVFQRIKLIARSDELQAHLKIMINLFLIAGLVEAHFTIKIVELISRL